MARVYLRMLWSGHLKTIWCLRSSGTAMNSRPSSAIDPSSLLMAPCVRDLPGSRVATAGQYWLGEPGKIIPTDEIAPPSPGARWEPRIGARPAGSPAGVVGAPCGHPRRSAPIRAPARTDLRAAAADPHRIEELAGDRRLEDPRFAISARLAAISNLTGVARPAGGRHRPPGQAALGPDARGSQESEKGHHTCERRRTLPPRVSRRPYVKGCDR